MSFERVLVQEEYKMNVKLLDSKVRESLHHVIIILIIMDFHHVCHILSQTLVAVVFVRKFNQENSWRTSVV